jgi:hypothetical protein
LRIFYDAIIIGFISVLNRCKGLQADIIRVLDICDPGKSGIVSENKRNGTHQATYSSVGCMPS